MDCPGACQSHSTDFPGVQQVDSLAEVVAAALLQTALDHASS